MMYVTEGLGVPWTVIVKAVVVELSVVFVVAPVPPSILQMGNGMESQAPSA